MFFIIITIIITVFTTIMLLLLVCFICLYLLFLYLYIHTLSLYIYTYTVYIYIYIYRHIQCIQARNLPIIPTAFFFQESFEVIQQNLWSDAAKASAASWSCRGCWRYNNWMFMECVYIYIYIPSGYLT